LGRSIKYEAPHCVTSSTNTNIINGRDEIRAVTENKGLNLTAPTKGREKKKLHFIVSSGSVPAVNNCVVVRELFPHNRTTNFYCINDYQC
jgi:hypothetical protein